MVATARSRARYLSGALAPIAAVGLVLTVLTIAVIYRTEFRQESPLDIEDHGVRVNRALLWKSLVTSAAMIVSFFVGWPVP
jgi:hypothetical protein